ncbi:UDP-2,3-diacylglucosamine diphosphatase [Hydrogenophaga sp. UC242_50]|uniref:UDP-2,3-diacylglucosamine diphosphatase n=1 Tax=Hydrogenophaga sp. UC242_50 TaxID=3350169 RepID=UPI0036D2A7C5
MTAQPVDRFAECIAPANWQAVDVISDLHLQAGEPETFEAWAAYLRRPAHERADALFILGDLFEVWVGDDVLSTHTSPSADHAFWRACAEALQAYSAHAPVYFMRGNRDFLLGPAGLDACGMQGLSDPTVLVFLDQRWLLSHGDALCLADTDYMRFRAEVREPAWQHRFSGTTPGPTRSDRARAARPERGAQAQHRQRPQPLGRRGHPGRQGLAAARRGPHADPSPHAPARDPRPG